MVNLLPAVQAYLGSRIEQLSKEPVDNKARIDELNMVLSLCNGLEHQQGIFERILTPDGKGLKNADS